MDGEIDLETYTISIIRLNSALEKIDNNEPISDIKEMFHESFIDLNNLYNEIVEDLNHDEVNINEYYLFFSNGKQIFPQYIEILKSIDNEDLDEEITSLMQVFNSLNKIAEPFSTNDMIK
ncbi:hypothetical protein [Methanobrevibacter sp.]|uniref:hypothetical protein n=1 Tax=Methanobrevibacter sp. TaxID=66852 RepID=UPI0038903768